MSTAVHPAIDTGAADEPGRPWVTMPGWGIAADLTPPEVVADRRVRMVRRRVLVGLAALVLVCGVIYVAVLWQQARTADALAVEQAQSEDLLNEGRRFAEVPDVKGDTAETERQIGELMAGDVDVAALLRTVRIQLPDDMTITEMSVNLDEADAAGDAVVVEDQPGAPVALDAANRRPIGTITISGGATGVADVAAFLDRLIVVDGLVSPLPLTNENTDTGVQYSMRITIDDTLLSHRFDQEPK